MASHKSALKEVRKDRKRNLRNRSARSTLRTALKTARAAIASGDAPAAQAGVARASSLLDRTARKGIIHPNVAARTKSRLAHGARKMSNKS